ncbi:hypothetical protein H312_02921 [Anncaliia algerae PRA339]|uniref:2-(3-amino-3-carboxypropyl)histidine synthase subunit 2 n=1 Tax=Anncaliia algerae PRA339 TaxID=1288291 RepID=A0A059EXN9_9MICR|nr:hypothetical protein H312_02921 [Anncaliia algerae PRA339]
MYKIDYDYIKENINNIRNVVLVPTEDSLIETMQIYDFIDRTDPSIDQVILAPTDFVCKEKIYDSYDLLIAFPPLCYLHSPEKVVKILNESNIVKLEDDKCFIADSTFFETEEKLHNKITDMSNESKNSKDQSDKLIIVTKTQRFYDYFFCLFDCKPYFDKILPRDKTEFLMKRICLFETIKEKTKFGLFFTSKSFLNIALDLKNFLKTRNKDPIMIFLKDISVERLIAYDYLEVVVVIDCPFFTYFDYNLHIPLITPFELVQSFKNSWKGDYEINFYNFEDIEKEDNITLNDNNQIIEPFIFNSVDYFRKESYDEDIHIGMSGCPSEYKRKE